MSHVKENDWIAVEYTGKLDDGKMFDTNKGKDPLKFQVGKKMVIPGFDEAVLDMEVDEEKEVTIACDKAYGPKLDKMVEIPKASFQKIDDLKIGEELTMMTNFGPMLIEPKEIGEEKVKVIINHPLAGKDLSFTIKVVKILDEDEIQDYKKELQDKYAKMQEVMQKQQGQGQDHSHDHSEHDCSQGCSDCCADCTDSEESSESDENKE